MPIRVNIPAMSMQVETGGYMQCEGHIGHPNRWQDDRPHGMDEEKKRLAGNISTTH